MMQSSGVQAAFRGGALLGAVISVALFAGSVRAAPAAPAGPTVEQKKKAIHLTRRASALNNLGKYGQAVKLFRRAVTLFPKLAGAWRNMGLAYEGLRKWKAATGAYGKYLDIAGTGGRYSLKVMARINECRKKLGLPPKVFSLLGAAGKIVLQVNVPGAAIKLNGLTRGSSPIGALPVNAGLHVVEITKVGYLAFNRSVGVKAGQTVRIRVTLQKDPHYVPPRRVEGIKHHKAPNEAYLRIDTQADGVQVLIDGKPMTQNDQGWWVVPKPKKHVVEVRATGRLPWRARVELLRGLKKTLTPILPLLKQKRTFALWGWVSVGVAAALAGVGGVFGALENKTFEKVRDRRAANRSDLKDLVDKGKMYRNISVGLYAVAGAALVSSIVLFIYERRGEHPKGRPLPLVVAPTERGTGVAVSWSGEVDF